MAVQAIEREAARPNIYEKAMAWIDAQPKTALDRFFECTTDIAKNGKEWTQKHRILLVAEYMRLAIPPETHYISAALRRSNDLYKLAITHSVQAMLILAGRDPRFGSVKHGEFGFDANGGVRSATAIVHRKDMPGEPFVATCLTEEFMQKYQGQPSGTWKEKRGAMTMKCAIAAVLRLAYAEALAGMFTPEEEGQFDPVDRDDDLVTHEQPPTTIALTGDVPGITARRVDAQTGEVLADGESSSAAAEPYSEPAVSASENPAQDAPAAESAQTPAAGTKPRSEAFYGLAKDAKRLPLVKRIYEFMGLDASKCQGSQHTLNLRIVAGVLKIDAPARWVDFSIEQLKGYLDVQASIRSERAATSEQVKSAPEQPKTEERPQRAPKPGLMSELKERNRNPNVISVIQENIFKGAAENFGLEMLQQFVREATDGRTNDFMVLNKAEAKIVLDRLEPIRYRHARGESV